MLTQCSIFSRLVDSSVISFFNQKKIYKPCFIEHIKKARGQLPKHPYCINLCEDRYLFLVLFVASITLRQINLLPSSRADKEIQRMQEQYPNNYKMDDYGINAILAHDHNSLIKAEQADFDISAEQVVVMVFTSGTTGLPKPNIKTWGQLKASAERVKQRLQLNKEHTVVATVPPQHMFGFETTIIYPLLCGVAIHAGRPFYPLDVQQALAEIPAPRVLISIPLHLKSCNNVMENWPEIDFILSATAPMPLAVAEMAEKTMNSRVMEIYGCSEVGAIATRQMTQNTDWHLLTDFHLIKTAASHAILAPGVAHAIDVPDQLEAKSDAYFKLVGRDADLINMGGKRGSIINLNNKINSIEGVEDAVFILPEEKTSKRSRLVAFVVSNSLDAQKIRSLLSEHIDAVFLPRLIIMVSCLPYNEAGKLPRNSLLTLLKHHLDHKI